jgi:phosphatidate cytidylyltransferase
VVTALLLAAALVAILFWLPGPVAVGAIMAVVAAGAWEWAGFVGLQSSRARAGYLLAVGLATAAAWWLSGFPGVLPALLWATLAWWLAGFAWVVLAPGRVSRSAAALAGLLVLVPAAVAIGRLAGHEPDGRRLLFLLVLLIAAADVGAYFGGRRFGRHKLAPRVSPGKTWEGLAAGVLAALLVAAAMARLLDLPALPWLAICLVVVLLSVVGDLLESMFKRRAGLKDSSALLPGHGGVLDRIDSLTAAGPAFLLGLLLLGVVP